VTVAYRNVPAGSLEVKRMNDFLAIAVATDVMRRSLGAPSAGARYELASVKSARRSGLVRAFAIQALRRVANALEATIPANSYATSTRR
jgi:hypothetical protein